METLLAPLAEITAYRNAEEAAIPIADIGMHRITKVPMDLWAYR